MGVSCNDSLFMVSFERIPKYLEEILDQMDRAAKKTFIDIFSTTSFVLFAEMITLSNFFLVNERSTQRDL